MAGIVPISWFWSRSLSFDTVNRCKGMQSYGRWERTFKWETYTCNTVKLELKSFSGMLPDNRFLLKWLLCKIETSSFNRKHFVRFNFFTNRHIEATHKCCVVRSWSNPGSVSVETGRRPLNWLSAKSRRTSLESLPREAGIFPLSLFDCRALWKSKNIC